MYLINKDETEHTGQVQRDSTLMTFLSIKNKKTVIILSLSEKRGAIISFQDFFCCAQTECCSIMCM